MPGHRQHDDPSAHPRRDRMDAERVSDPYRARGKPAEPTTCPECHAIFHRGRWQWGTPQSGAAEHLCPACLRIRDRVPAGEVTLSGAFYAEHRDEILALVRNIEATARAEHPLARIIDISDTDAGSVVTCTDGHLAHRIGKALASAYHGTLDAPFTDEGDLARVTWRR